MSSSDSKSHNAGGNKVSKPKSKVRVKRPKTIKITDSFHLLPKSEQKRMIEELQVLNRRAHELARYTGQCDNPEIIKALREQLSRTEKLMGLQEMRANGAEGSAEWIAATGGRWNIDEDLKWLSELLEEVERKKSEPDSD